MPSEYITSTYVAAGVVSVLAAGFSLPALTTREDIADAGMSYQELVYAEQSYCKSNLSSVNCACFAQKSGHVHGADPSPDSTIMTFADRKALARSQAASTC